MYASISYAQIRIAGSVTNAEGEPLVGCTVLEKGTTNGTIVREDGLFTLALTQEKAVLSFQYIGFEDFSVAVVESTKLAVVLTKKATQSAEIVVTALNQRRAAKDLGYAVQQLNAKELSEIKSPNFVDNLAGQIAGVTVSQGATGVGSSSKISIRGEASFTNNNPLFVIDGVPINNNTSFNFTNAAAAGFQEVDFGNGAMELNADDIANVNVLKGPGAAALYGTRASNGVIIITTKDGSKSKGIGVSINSTTSIETPFTLPKFQNKYGQGNSGEFAYQDGLGSGINDNISYSWGPRLDAGLVLPQYNSPVVLANGSTVRAGDIAVRENSPITPTPFVSQPDNLKDFYRVGSTTTNNIAISSGFDRGSVRLSFTDLQSKSFIPGVNLDRKTIATHLTFRPIDKLKIVAGINYIHSQSDNRPANGYGSENVNYSLVAWGPRSLDIGALQDYWQPGLEGQQQYSFNYTFFDNPYFILLENRNSFRRDRVIGNIGATYDFTESLSLTVTSGMDYSGETRRFLRNYSTNRFSMGAYAEQDNIFREVNTNFLLHYTKKRGVFTSDFSLGGNRLDQTIGAKQTQTLSLAQSSVFNFSNAAAPIQVFQFTNNRRINSLYGIVKFGYKDFLYVDITGRNDWSSTLATPNSADNTSFFYPSISASYILSNVVEFLPSWVSFSKLRVSLAQVGNDTDPYSTSGAFEAGIPYNAQPTFTAQSAIPNASLLPEQTTAYELGTDIRMFNGRVLLDFTYYTALTRNQIISFPVPVSSGYTERIVNGGSVRSQGVEAIVGVTPIKKKDFIWTSMFNFSRNVSTVAELPQGVDKLTLAFSSVYDNVNQTVWFQVEEGGRIGDMYGTGYLKNENGQFVLNENGEYVADNTLKKLGNFNPDFILGITNSLKYKNFDLTFLLDWRQGGELVSRTLALAGVGGQLIETENRPEEGIVADGQVNVGSQENPRWEENTTAVSAEQYYRQYYDRNHEENNTYSATYIKLRQFSVGYTFDADRDRGLLKEGRSLRIAFIGRNIAAWSTIPHFDPEQLAVQGNRFISGVEDMSYPTARSLGFKVGYSF